MQAEPVLLRGHCGVGVGVGVGVDGVCRGRDSQELVKGKAITEMARCEGRGFERLLQRS